jgi:cold shock CspA family protein/ribosome-associated translation inhibitor RaiA
MKQPLELTFHEVDRSAWVEDYIRKRVARLERIADDIIWCRVALEQPSRSRTTGNYYRVSIELSLPPNKDLVAAKERAIEDPQMQLRPLIKSAFEAMERQIKKTVERRRYDVKTHAEPPHGMVAQLFPRDGYGFIRCSDGRELYFHRRSVLQDGFERLAIGTEVRFVDEPGEEGPQASSVQILSKQGPREGAPGGTGDTEVSRPR